MVFETTLGLGRLWKEQLEADNKPRQDSITLDHKYVKAYTKWKKENPDKEIILVRKSTRVKKEHFKIVELKKDSPELKPKKQGKVK